MINSKHSLHPILLTSSHYWTKIENYISAQGGIFMVSTVIYSWLGPQLTWILQVNDLILLLLRLPPTIIQSLTSQLLQISVSERRLFANAVEELDTRLTRASFVVLKVYHPILGEVQINSMHFMVMNNLNYQYSGTSNIQQYISNITPLLPKKVLWFHLTRIYSIIMQLIMSM